MDYPAPILICTRQASHQSHPPHVELGVLMSDTDTGKQTSRSAKLKLAMCSTTMVPSNTASGNAHFQGETASKSEVVIHYCGLFKTRGWAVVSAGAEDFPISGYNRNNSKKEEKTGHRSGESITVSINNRSPCEIQDWCWEIDLPLLFDKLVCMVEKARHVD